jgi:hypothetical protein
MQPWQASQQAAQQAQRDWQRSVQYSVDAVHRHAGGGVARRPRSAIGRLLYGVFRFVLTIIALAVFAVVALIGYFVITSH